MKNKDRQTLHDKSMKELSKMLGELTAQLAVARIEKKAGKLANTSSVKLMADDIARVKTVMNIKRTVVATQAVEKTVKDKE